MQDEGPLLEALTHRLGECPADFLAQPVGPGGGQVDVAAVVCDLLRAMGAAELPAYQRAVPRLFRPAQPGDDNRARLAAVAAWLLHDPWFLARPNLAPAAWKLLADGLAPLARVLRPEAAVADPDRREELVRFCLKALGLRPAGETVAQAADRLNTLDSAERQRVLRETRAAEERTRQIREAMARKAAEEAAARYSPE